MAIVGPVALYSNLPIHADYYQPSRFIISALSLGATTTVTTTADNNYVVGQLCRLVIPPTFGCRQLNGQSAYVISIPSATQVVLALDSSKADPYIASSATTQAQILAIGDIGNGSINNSGRQNLNNYVPGSFRNISPN